jgi:hypothetical protein
MLSVQKVENINECRELWNKMIPQELVSDLWEVRYCFHTHYRHKPCFLVAEENNRIKGFLPLSWNAETGKYNYFPGETWEGKSWLEQNRIITDNPQTLNTMLLALDGPYHLRYLREEGFWSENGRPVDEIGYLFIPENYGFDLNRYYEAFSHKSAKKLKKELDKWNIHNVEWQYNNIDDFEILCQMNRSRFGRLSYFHDERFLASFRSLVKFLNRNGWLRIVKVSIDGEPAAVDMGSLYNGMLTMLAGGTSEEFRGIAKLINIHHITYACEQKLDSVDFLCGDFNWKTLFHLTPTPLYLIEGNNVPETKVEKPSVNYRTSIFQMRGNRGAPNV